MTPATRRQLGAGIVCPRCKGRKPKGDCGMGIARSRRGDASICSDCGRDEALFDLGLRTHKQHEKEIRLIGALRARGAEVKVSL